MKKIILTAAVLLSISSLANAKNVDLQGDAADSFIARHFPDAGGGPVSGVFKYTNKRGLVKQGYAECDQPVMGGRSNGQVSTCSVIY